MKQTLTILLVCLATASCRETVADKDNPIDSSEVLIRVEDEQASAAFDFSRFKIGEGRVSNISVGQTLSQAELELVGLKREEIESYGVGFDGGGAVYLYSYNDEPVLALVPSHESDTLIAIVAIHRELQTTNGLHPKMKVKELIAKYPDMVFYQDLLNGGEFSDDLENRWSFVFDTKEESEIGVYPELEVGSKAHNLKPEIAWITVK
jgi:hypothetical protein